VKSLRDMGKFRGTSSSQQTPTCFSKNVTHNWDAEEAHTAERANANSCAVCRSDLTEAIFCGSASNAKHPASVTAVKGDQRYSASSSCARLLRFSD